jgi:hydroxymethylbilane synthase
MAASIRIGTRDSALAQWQAENVQLRLNQLGHSSELVFIKSKGDLNRDQPLHQLGGVGVFTKALDDALLNNEIDLAVHSLKDVPTLPHHELQQAAVLERHAYHDVLIGKSNFDFLESGAPATIGTGSIRRKAQWLHRYPNHQIVGIRGNVGTRLDKVKNGNMDATILSEAGLERLNIQPSPLMQLDWMIPAPAQGVIGLFCRKNDTLTYEKVHALNHRPTSLTSQAERALLRELEGGCSAPIGALAKIEGSHIDLTAILLSIDGKDAIQRSKRLALSEVNQIGKALADEIKNHGGEAILNVLKAND